MKKLLILASAALLAACNTTGENTYYANDGYEFTPDPTKSLALNVMQAGGTTRLLKDAELPEDAWDDVSTAQYATGFTVQFLQNGILGGLTSLIIDSNINDAAPLDWPNYVAWIPVSTYGFSEELQKEALKKNEANIKAAIVEAGGDDITVEYQNDMTVMKFKGQLCDTVENKIIPLSPLYAKKYKEFTKRNPSNTACALWLTPEVIRPSGNIFPKNVHGEFIIVRTRIDSLMDFNILTVIPNGYYTYIPPSWGTTDIKFGNGVPYLMDSNNQYLFVKPNNGREAVIKK